MVSSALISLANGIGIQDFCIYTEEQQRHTLKIRHTQSDIDFMKQIEPIKSLFHRDSPIFDIISKHAYNNYIEGLRRQLLANHFYISLMRKLTPISST